MQKFQIKMPKQLFSTILCLLLTTLFIVSCGKKAETKPTLLGADPSVTGVTEQQQAAKTTVTTAPSEPDTAQYDRRLHGEVSTKALQNKPQFLNVDDYTLHVFFLPHEVKNESITVPLLSFITVYEKDGSAPYIGSYTRTSLQNIDNQTLIEDLRSLAQNYGQQYNNIAGITYKLNTESNFYIDDQVFFSLPEIAPDQIANLPDFIHNRSSNDYSLGSDYARLQQSLKDEGYTEITEQIR